jgi:CubicO group peptidase (beta-lactamase class C family)
MSSRTKWWIASQLRFAAGLRPWPLLLAALVAGASPLVAQPAPNEDPLITSACDASLAKELAVQGLNPVWEAAEPLSSAEIPSLGFSTSDMASAIDATVGNYMNLYGIPGGAVAITYQDRLIFAKSYGYIAVPQEVFAEPDSRFRAASVSKSITAMGILKQVHDGLIKLDDTPFPFANVPTIIGGTPGNLFVPGTFNKDLATITVDDLLHHAGGWDRNVAPDLTGYDVLQALAAFETSLTSKPQGPPDCTSLLSYVESQPLQFTPGTETHYSNVGFCALSEVIREHGGGSYIDYLTTNVLTPLGMVDTALGQTPIGLQLDRESTSTTPRTPRRHRSFRPTRSSPRPTARSAPSRRRRAPAPS